MGAFCPGSLCEFDDDCFSEECNFEEAVCLGDVPGETECIEIDDYEDIEKKIEWERSYAVYVDMWTKYVELRDQDEPFKTDVKRMIHPIAYENHMETITLE